MVTNMLKAIHQMLELKGGDNAQEGVARVACARIMLGEIIKGMECTTTTISDASITHAEHPQLALKHADKPSPLTSALETKDHDYTMEIDQATKTLKWMKCDGKELLPTQALRIDGKIIEYTKAKGMAFKKLEVVEDAE